MKPTATTYSRMRDKVVRTVVAAALAFGTYFTADTALAKKPQKAPAFTNRCAYSLVVGRIKAPFKVEKKKAKVTEEQEVGGETVRIKLTVIKPTRVTLYVPTDKKNKTLAVVMPGQLFDGMEEGKLAGAAYANGEVAVDKYLMNNKKPWECQKEPSGRELDLDGEEGAAGEEGASRIGAPEVSKVSRLSGGRYKFDVRKDAGSQSAFYDLNEFKARKPFSASGGGVERLMQAKKPEISGIYNQTLKKNPNINGKVEATLTVGANGRVKKVVFSNSLLDPELMEKYAGFFARARFAKSTAEWEAVVPLIFTTDKPK